MKKIVLKEFVLSIIVPVYNEKETILEVIEAILDVPCQKEVIVVDDGSTDGTRELLAQKDFPEVRVLLHEKNASKGLPCKLVFPLLAVGQLSYKMQTSSTT